ncbi:Uncharacterized protein FKW44_008247, partial [Caligus rogercresseyi]
SDPQDMEPITPAHLCLFRPLSILSDFRGKEVDLKFGTSIWMVQRIPPPTTNVWEWRSKTDDVDVNDIVLISEETHLA